MTIGFIGAPHGVRGTVRVRSVGAGRHLREDVRPVVDGRRRRIVRVRPTPKGYLVDLENVSNRSLAADLRGKELVLDRTELDELDEEEFYVEDLIGLRAFNTTGEDLGVVEEVLETPAHEVLILRNRDLELYVPFTREHAPDVDLENRQVVVAPPDGV
ncbi:MAG: ribosome maturation factor RimM [Rubrobacteraceae bacterium]